MDDQAPKANRKQRPFTLFAGGCLVVLYLILCSIAVVFGRTQITNGSSPTLTATKTSIPHILVNPPADQNIVIYEDFSSNRRDWGLYYPNGKLEVIEGKLILQSNVTSTLVIGTSSQFSISAEVYYIQADFSTDIDTTSPYGLIFGLNRSLSTFYTFEIWPLNGGYRLFKYNAGRWTGLTPYSRTEFNPYPQANTLSIYFNSGSMKLYINGQLVSEYLDSDFYQSKEVGIFVTKPDYRLIVDDFFVYDEK